MAESATHQRIEALTKSDKVVLFMKGNRAQPQCGFSATVVGILDQYVPDYTTVNVLADPEIREGVKEFSDWPTIPQLYVDGEFVGGCDIVRQLDDEGELIATLGDAAKPPEPPSIEITEAAAAVFKQAMAEAEGDEQLRLVVSPTFQHELALDLPRPSDLVVEAAGLKILVDPGTTRRANGLRIDHVEGPQVGFRMDNPNAPAQVQQIGVKEAAALVKEDGVKFFDVRTPRERSIAKLEGAIHLDGDNVGEMMELPKDTPLVFHCHHGHRSFQAAIRFLEQGFTKVYNVVGGIDAWSQQVDPSIPRY
ncbi:MAG: Grx4 family monothiol glutaredoxin [Nannocystaceae bacterium]|nr:Grx4 family monothiol glutaredoxin [bacterium]